jgi:hypothetical protein
MSGVTGQAGVVQSGDEALASLMEEMKEIMGAPVFKDTPLQSVARRFWMALNDAQKSQQKNEERLEQNLGKLKGDYLLARAVRYITFSCCAELNCARVALRGNLVFETDCGALTLLSVWYFRCTGMGGTAEPVQGSSGRLQGKVCETKESGNCERRGLYGPGTEL